MILSIHAHLNTGRLASARALAAAVAANSGTSMSYIMHVLYDRLFTTGKNGNEANLCSQQTSRPRW